MLKNATRRVKALVRHDDYPGQEIIHFPVEGLLPAGHSLVSNMILGTLVYLVCSADGPQMLAEEQFTSSEMRVLLPLLQSYPHYCPHEMLLANFSTGSVSEVTVARCRQHLQDAQDAGTWDQEMRPVRNVLSRARLKLRPLGLDILSIFETGYILLPVSERGGPGRGRRRKGELSLRSTSQPEVFDDVNEEIEMYVMRDGSP
jgi:hypothetical protein